MKKPLLSAIKAAARKAQGTRLGKPQGTKRGIKGYDRKREKRKPNE